MRLYLPIFPITAFIGYVLYLTFVKKDLKRNLSTVVYPGLFYSRLGSIYAFYKQQPFLKCLITFPFI